MKFWSVLLFIAVLSWAGSSLAGSAVLTRAEDGHWWADVKVNGRPVRVLVDTGATLVALTAADARRAGIDLRDLTYSVAVDTAAGKVKAARVRLDIVAVGNARLRDVDAMVLSDGLDVSVLGMSYLKRLERLDVRGDRMRLED